MSELKTPFATSNRVYLLVIIGENPRSITAFSTLPETENLRMGLNDNVESVFDRIARFDALIVEFIGTFFLCLSFVTSGGNGTAVGLTVLVLVYAFGYISGAHYNPAVTIGVISTARGVISIKNAILYIIIQLVASFIAAGIGWGMVAQPDNDLFMLPIPEPGAGYNWAQAFLAETFYTFALVTVALHVASTKSQEANSFFGLAVAFTIIAAELSIGRLSSFLTF